MSDKKWLLYGANGYTGKLITELALARGHKPVLAGRSEARLRPLAEASGLEMRIFDLSNAQAVAEQLADVALVMHAAGPYLHTAAPMVEACLQSSTHYLDITGEAPVMEANFALDSRAREANVLLLSGTGFDVVPSDCLACYVAEKIDTPAELSIVFCSTAGSPSPGTMKTMLSYVHKGVFARRNGKYVPVSPADLQQRIHFPDRERTVLPITWGDLATAYRSTGIANITTFTAYPGKSARMLPALRFILRFAPARKLALRWVEKNITGPDEKTRATARSYFYGHVKNAKGEQAEAWLETPEGYRLTAETAVRCVERVLAGHYTGAATPAQLFGADFILDVPEVRRLDAITKISE